MWHAHRGKRSVYIALVGIAKGRRPLRRPRRRSENTLKLDLKN
jgi:hypothetical protein